MKRLFSFILFSLFFVLLLACQNEQDLDPDQSRPISFETISEEIDQRLPLYLNKDFLLPQFDDVELNWYFNDEAINETLLYNPPLIDALAEVQVDIIIDNVTKRYHYSIVKLALDSALNQNMMQIFVDIPIQDVTKTTYRNAMVSVESRVNGEREIVFENNQVEIRGRGNSTWGMPKRPYRLRFSEDVSILGMPAARNYVLLAEYADKSLLRNTIAYKFSGMLEHIEHAAQTRAVEVYFNGLYHGVYTLTEHMEIHENKLYVEQISNAVDTGYFLELDKRFYQHGNVIGVDGISVAGNPYEIKEPSPGDDLTAAQIAFIQNYFVALEQALIAKEGYQAYIDIDNFIDYFIVQELFKNVDVGWGSVFIYKRPGDVIKLGPIWDFDLAIGNADYIDYGTANWYGMRSHKNRWFRLMMDIPEVREQFKTRYLELYEEEIPLLLEAVESLGTAMIPLANRNFRRWDILGQYHWPNPPEMVEATTYSGQVEYLYNYIEQRAEWIYYAVQTQNYQNGYFD